MATIENEIVQAQDEREVETHLGNRYAVHQIQKRIMQMMPGASEAPADVVWAAAQLAVAHKLNPFNGEIYIIKLGRKPVDGPNGKTEWVDEYRPHIGVKGLRRKAREQSDFMAKYRDMTPEEVKAYRRADYDAEDVGVECTLYHLGAAMKAKMAGLDYEPVRATGFWRKKASYNKKENKWYADNVPNTWTAQMVAKKRAEINAIKEAFDLTIDIADPATTGEADMFSVVALQMAEMDRETALPAPRQHNREDDGQILLAGKGPRRSAPRVEEPIDADFYTPDYDDTPDYGEPGEDTDAPFPQAQPTEQEPEPMAETDYAAVYEQTTGNDRMFVEWCRKRHLADGGPCTVPQYRYLTGVIDALCDGNPRGHRAVLTVLTGRRISSENRPSFALADKLLDWLPETRIEDEVKVANPQYRADMAQIVKRLWLACLELEGQLRLLLE